MCNACLSFPASLWICFLTHAALPAPLCPGSFDFTPPAKKPILNHEIQTSGRLLPALLMRLVARIARPASLAIWHCKRAHRRPNSSESPNRRHFASLNLKMHTDISHRRPTSQDFRRRFCGIFPVTSFRSSLGVFAWLAKRLFRIVSDLGGAQFESHRTSRLHRTVRATKLMRLLSSGVWTLPICKDEGSSRLLGGRVPRCLCSIEVIKGPWWSLHPPATSSNRSPCRQTGRFVHNQDLSEPTTRSVPTTPGTSAQVSRYKWEPYRDTNWWCVYVCVFDFLPRGGHTVHKYSDRNGRCIAILFKSIGVRIDLTLLKP